MLTATTGLPYSFFSLLSDRYLTVPEGFSHRPDRLVSEVYEESFFIEAMCNEASNVSPISCEAGTTYWAPSRLFLKHFLEVS